MGQNILLQKDITDPSDSIQIPAGTTFVDEATWKGYYAAATWTSITSGIRAPFASLESTSNLFNNELGEGKAKWYDSGVPSYVQLTFPEAFVLTHFTLSSGNDCMFTGSTGSNAGRNPQSWAILGSNDGNTWTPIYQYSDAEPFTSTTNTSVLFTSFADVNQNTALNTSQKEQFSSRMNALSKSVTTTDFQNTTAYSQYRLEVYSTTGGGGTQLGEWELFGNTVLPTDQGNFLSSTLSPTVHLDASDSSSLVTDAAGNVSAWSDTSGNGFLYSQSNSANQPSVGTITIGDNDFPSLIFSKDSTATRGGDFLTSNQTSTPKTVFIVADVDSTNGNGGIFGRDAGDFGIRMNSSSEIWQWTNPGNDNDFTSNGGEMTYNGAETVLDIQNPHLVMAVTTNTSFNNYFTALGSYFTIGGHGPRPYGGKIAEVLTFEGTLTESQTRMVNTYFYAKYGLEIAEENRFGVAFSPTHNKDFFAVMRSEADDYAVDSYGTGGLGVGASTNGYDIFNRSLTDGTAIFVTSNTDSEFRFTESVTTTGDKIFAWDKEWLLQNLSSDDALSANSMIDLAFNLEDALFPFLEEGSQWALLFREETDQPYQQVSDFLTLEGTGLFFSISLNDLTTGFYTLGSNQAPSDVPEPATWGMLLLGLAGFWVMKRRVR
ncbi:MAG: PEP-CTERM sorting domain-containing protein [Planctomycetia bacterium]|nr:PEP-CTERM sorting domain-containing protein [Planctomycetia bacterium]